MPCPRHATVSAIALAAALAPAAPQAATVTTAIMEPIVESADGATVTVESTGSVTIDADTDKNAVTMGGANASVDNAGTIESESEEAVVFEGDGGTLTNTGTIISGEKEGVQAEKDFTLHNSGTITAVDDGVNADDGADITNTGTITVTGLGDDAGDGINVNDDSTVTNETGATIEATSSEESDGIQVNGGSTVINRGTVKAGKHGVNAGEEDDVEVVNEGLIEAGNEGVKIDTGNNGRVENIGTIISGDEGIEAGDATVIDNSGTITAVEDAVQVGRGATITNAGTIESTAPSGGGDGLDIDDGSVTNSGVISAVDGAGIDVDGPVKDSSDPNPPAAVGDLTVVNAGTIRGLIGIQVETETFTEDGETFFPNDSAQIIDTSGTIEGTDGIAMLLGAGNDIVTLREGAQVIGETLFGDDDDLLAFEAMQTVDGYDSLFDGGDGTDRVVFAFGLSFLRTSTQTAPNTVSLGFFGTNVDFDVTLANFETFHIGGEEFTFEEVVAAVPAIPLPAGFWLLGGGLAGLVWLRRRAAFGADPGARLRRAPFLSRNVARGRIHVLMRWIPLPLEP